ncbi:MAG: SDR family oxidoreductase [Stappiaceae bacterium]
MRKVILITGTSTGLGISIAVDAAKAGHKVYASMRNLEKRGGLDEASQAAGVELDVLQLDVRDAGTILAAVDRIVEAEGRIDTLVNNAGVGFVRSTEQASEDDINWVMDVNFMGVVRCTKAVLPYMRKQRRGHVLTVSSVGGLVGQPFNEIYCGSKFAVEGYMESLASYVGPSFGLHFTVVEPGGIRSEFANNVMKHIGKTGGMLEDEYLPILKNYIGTSQARGDVAYQSAEEVAAVVMKCIEAEVPPVRTRTSEWSEDLCRMKTEGDPDGKKLQAKVVEDFLGKID